MRKRRPRDGSPPGTPSGTGEAGFKPSCVVPFLLLVHVPPSWGEHHLEFSDSQSGGLRPCPALRGTQCQGTPMQAAFTACPTFPLLPETSSSFQKHARAPWGAHGSLCPGSLQQQPPAPSRHARVYAGPHVLQPPPACCPPSNLPPPKGSPQKSLGLRQPQLVVMWGRHQAGGLQQGRAAIQRADKRLPPVKRW